MYEQRDAANEPAIRTKTRAAGHRKGSPGRRQARRPVTQVGRGIPADGLQKITGLACNALTELDAL